MRYRTGATSDGRLDGGRRAHPHRRRRLQLVRPRDHLLLGSAPDRPLRLPGLPLRLHARLHQQAALRPQARARLGAAALRLRGAARPAGREAAARSDRAAAAQPAAAGAHDRQRPAHHLERLRRSASTRVEEASGWSARRGRLGFGRGLGVAGSMYISGTNYPIYPNQMPQSGSPAQGRPLGPRHGLLGRQRHRPGDRTRSCRSWWPRSSDLALDQVRVVCGRHRPLPGGPGGLLQPRHVHGRQRGARCLPQAPRAGWCKPWPSTGRSSRRAYASWTAAWSTWAIRRDR